MRVLSFPDLATVKGIRFSRQHIYRLIAAGDFPAPISIGDRSVAFVESEIDAWIEARPRANVRTPATA